MLPSSFLQILTELEHSGVGRIKEQSARMLGHLVSNAPRLIRPYMEPILKVQSVSLLLCLLPSCTFSVYFGVKWYSKWVYNPHLDQKLLFFRFVIAVENLIGVDVTQSNNACVWQSNLIWFWICIKLVTLCFSLLFKYSLWCKFSLWGILGGKERREDLEYFMYSKKSSQHILICSSVLPRHWLWNWKILIQIQIQGWLTTF